MWCKQVALSPLEVLPSLFSQVLEQLSPPLAQCVHVALQDKDEAAPATLLELRQVRLRNTNSGKWSMAVACAVQAMLRFMASLEREVGGAKEEMEVESVHKGLFGLVECVHSPYCQLLVRYPNMETQSLKHKLHLLDMVREGGREGGGSDGLEEGGREVGRGEGERD